MYKINFNKLLVGIDSIASHVSLTKIKITKLQNKRLRKSYEIKI